MSVYHGDCLEVMEDFETDSIDMVLCDLPYGSTRCKWDAIIPLEPLWMHYRRIVKPSGAIVLTCQEPFASFLRLSNLEMYKYDWIWSKSKPTGMGQANRRPMRYHELISIFYAKQPVYNKQMIPRLSERTAQAIKNKNTFNVSKKQSGNQQSVVYTDIPADRYDPDWKNPSTILEFPSIPANAKEWRGHPTQKPLRLFEYFIKTYTNPGELVLDNAAGSGTTGEAALRLGRKFILIEKDPAWYAECVERIEEVQNGLESI